MYKFLIAIAAALAELTSKLEHNTFGSKILLAYGVLTFGAYVVYVAWRCVR